MEKLSDKFLKDLISGYSGDKDSMWPADLASELLDSRKELATLQEATRWIPVGEQLPEEYKSILLLTPNENIVIGSREGDRYMIDKPPDDWGFGHGFTHWMPLPVLPEGGAK